MSKSFAPQAIALVLAVLVTGALLGSVGQVADTQFTAAAEAQTPVQTLETQYVVITAKRLPRV
jgi:hypothetical protein